MALVFTVSEFAAVRQHKKTATLTLLSEGVSPGAVRRAYREYVAHDADGNVLGRTHTVATEAAEVGDARPLMLTVISVERVAVTADPPAGMVPRGIVHADAKACGHKTVGALRDAWRARHRSDLALLVHFEWGDTREVPRFLTATSSMRWGPSGGGWRTRPGVPTGPLSDAEKRKAIEGAGMGDYTSSPARACDELEAVDHGTEGHFAALNWQKDLRRQADVQRGMAERTEAQRLEAATRTAERIMLNDRREISVITDRVGRAEKARRAAA